MIVIVIVGVALAKLGLRMWMMVMMPVIQIHHVDTRGIASICVEAANIYWVPIEVR